MPAQALVLLLIVPLLLLSGPDLRPPAAAAQTATRVYCPLPEEGIWVDKAAKWQELTRLEVEATCVDDRVQVRARAFMRCSPRDCKWGWTEAELRPGGGVRVRLEGFFGTRDIKMRAFGDNIEADVLVVPHDPLQQEELTSHILKRARR
ncbi:hypothetical protein [Pannonibacter tanglangensis]|uniref:hypothetical protein n=1 Tax=Pannonibacter tanglangensis TaxID=2750084 RepID=UPI001AD8DD16|nr:hypothetical protein [Pannonibacter sp. XCT-53]